MLELKTKMTIHVNTVICLPLPIKNNDVFFLSCQVDFMVVVTGCG